MPSEKRSFKRFNLFIVVEFRPLGGRAEPFWGITRNFSDKGFSFESQKFSIENGGLLECIFKQPDNQMTVSIPGKIAWKEESDKFQCLTGVKLQDLNEERKAKLLAIMSATGELPSEFFPDDGKTEVAAAIPENNMSKQEEIELSPEEPVSEIGSARLEEPVETAKKSISEEKEGEPERKTPFLIPVTAFIIGVALFVVIKKYDEFFRDLTGFSKKQTIVERVEEQQPQSVDEIPRNDTIMSSEVSIPFDVKAPEEKENVLTRPETYLPDRTDADSGYIPEINTGQPILPEEELINSVKDHVKQAEPDQLVTVPEKESALVSKDLINDMLEIRKFVEINQKQSEEEKIAEATVNKKPANTVELVSEAEVLVKEKEGSSAVTVMSGEADKVQTETPGDEVKKEPENVAEQSVLVKEQKEEDIVLLMEDDKFVPDLPDAETKSITVETLPESKIEPMERVEVPAEAPAEPVDITGILKEKVEGSSIAFILTDTKKEEKVV
ncbi:MAG: PilZ domain-containing protein, partial [Nitrospirota bacterium]